MTIQDIYSEIKRKNSFLCVGLDSDIKKIPSHLLNLPDPLFEFNKQIVDATHDVSIAYKPNIAFYESLGSKGWQSLEKTVEYIKNKYPKIFLIADAKRGDIGNTSKMYAKTFFENMNCDAVTVAPYMGKDSVSPFHSYKNKFVILLALTSNEGAADFQFFRNESTNQQLFEKVLSQSQQWGTTNNLMYVVGATKAQMLKQIRSIVPEHFLLVPGVGAQGGSLDEVAKYGMNRNCGLIVNSSRAIIYADNTKMFAEKARQKAIETQQQMKKLLDY